MLNQIQGLHHVTSLASSAKENNTFFTNVLGLRRVKKTVNFDAPDVYHLYYGDEVGSPGTVMTYFPFPNAARGRRGTGEVGVTSVAIPKGTSEPWVDRLTTFDVAGIARDSRFGETRVLFSGPDGDRFALLVAERHQPPSHLAHHLPVLLPGGVLPVAAIIEFALRYVLGVRLGPGQDLVREGVFVAHG